MKIIWTDFASNTLSFLKSISITKKLQEKTLLKKLKPIFSLPSADADPMNLLLTKCFTKFDKFIWRRNENDKYRTR